MPEGLAFLLYLAAFVCFILAALGVPLKRLSPLGIGLACWVLVPLWNAYPG